MMMNPVIVANQRKQTANMVSAIVGGVGGGGAAAASNTTTNKKPLRKKPSQRQARPIIMVHPGQYGEIANPNVNDVLSGRGGRINGHPGNVQYREMVNATKDRYLDPKTKKLEKAHIAAEIVYEIRSMNPPGRFLAEQVNGHWLEIGDARAFKKVGQALREDAPEIRATDGSEEILDSDLTNNTSPTTITSTTPSTKKKNSGVTKPPSKTATSSSSTTNSSTNSNKKQPSGSTSLDMTTNIVTTTTTTTTTPIMTNMQTPRTPSSSKKTTTTTSTTTSKRGGRMGQYSPVSDSNPTSITNPYYLPTVTTPLPAFAQSNMIISGAAAQTLQDFEMPRAGGGGGIISTTMPKVATTTPITSTSTHAVPASDELFDRQFFPLPLSSSDCYGTNPIHNDRESSILSGVSCPSAMSGVSQISGLTDPMSMISETTTAAAAAPVIMTTTAPSSSSQPYHPRATPIIVPTVSQLQQFYYVPTEPSQQQQQQQQHHHPQPPPHVPIHNLEDDNMSWMTMMMIQMEATKHSSHPSTAVSSRPLPQRPPTLYPPYATSTTTIASTNASVTSMTLGGDEMSQLSEQFNELYKDIEGCSLPSVNGGGNNGPSPKTLWEV